MASIKEAEGNNTMYRRMLVPLDGSVLAEVVLPYARQLTDVLRLETTLLHVCAAGESPSLRMCEGYIEHQAKFIALGEGAGSESKSVRGEVLTGNPAEAILQYASQYKSDLILMATHGRSGIGRWAVGSVAHKVLTASPVPVLLVRANTPPEIVHDQWPKKVVVPLDGSPVAELAIAHLDTLVAQRQSRVEVVLLRICQPPDLLSDYPEAIMPHTWEEHAKQATVASERACGLYLEEAQRRLEVKGIKVRSDVLLGDRVADEIIRYVQKTPFDLIVMTTHGHSGAVDWPYGHVADRIMQTVPVPLLLIRPPKAGTGQ